MSRPYEILNKRYGNVFLSKSKSLKVISKEVNADQGDFYVVYNTVLETGSINPTVLSALVKSEANHDPIQLKDLNYVSLHVRSYNSWDDLTRAGVQLENNNPQKPTVGALHECTDCQMVAVSETDNSKTYYFNDQGDGRITIFTAKPTISTGGNDLPRKTTFLPWVNAPNFVYERN
jgi:hypothetical protein